MQAMTQSLKEGARLMLWASGNPSTLHAENDQCSKPDHCGGICVYSGFVMVKKDDE